MSQERLESHRNVLLGTRMRKSRWRGRGDIRTKVAKSNRCWTVFIVVKDIENTGLWSYRALVTCKATTSTGCGQRGNMGNEWAPPQLSTHGIIIERLLCARCWSTNLGFCPQMLRLVSLPLFTQSSGINRDVENVWPIPHWRWEAENKAKHSLGNVGKVYWFQGKKGEEGKEAEEEWVAEKRTYSFVF